MIYTFTEADHHAAILEAEIKRKNFQKHDSQTPWGRYDFKDGIYGEIAMEHWLGVERQHHELGKLGDGGFDFEINDSWPCKFCGGPHTVVDVTADNNPGYGHSVGCPIRLGEVKPTQTLDVKTTGARGAWENAHLLIAKRMPLRSDVYVLVVLSPDRTQARFAGWASREEVESAKLKRKNQAGRPKVYVPTRIIPEADLHHSWRGWEK